MWSALGDVEHYVEPFFGGGAALLRRPHPCNRTYHSETVNDIDGFLVNVWRSIQLSPDATADAASWPVSEADTMARHLRLLQWREERDLERLMADPDWHDAKMAGWWLQGCSNWIGSGWCAGTGPWVVGADGRITKRAKDDSSGARVPRQLPRLGNDGQGVNRPQLREPGVRRQLPHLGSDGQGVNRPQLREPGVWSDDDFHPMTMPELRAWMRFLAARLRHVRIMNGDWTRAVTNGASKTINVRMGKGCHCGIFVDPPYSAEAGRAAGCYANEDYAVAHAVREWALKRGTDEDTRIVLAGFSGEGHEMLTEHGWREVEWFKAGFLRGGMGNQNESGHQQGRERLWLSPHCLHAEKARSDDRQGELFAGVGP